MQVSYAWQYRGRWNRVATESSETPLPLQAGSQEEFITEHFWGYAQAGRKPTGEYQVAHPRWDLYQVQRYQVDCDFAALYGSRFADLARREPQSVFLAEGSAVEVYSKKNIVG